MTARLRGLGREVAVATVGTALTRLLGAVGGVVVARWLGPADRGALAAVVVVGTLVGTAATAGVQYWATRTTARGGASANVLVALQRQAVIALVVFTSAGLVLQAVAADPAWVAGAVLALGWTWAALALSVPNGLRQLGFLSVAQVCGAVTYIGLTTALFLLSRPSVPLAVLGVASAQWVIVALGAHRSLRELRRGPSSSPTRAADIYRETGPASLSELLIVAAGRVDVLIVAALLAPEQVGYYVVAVSIAELSVVLADAAAQVALPFIGGDSEIRSVAPLHRAVLLLSGAATVGVISVAPVAVPLLFGDEFRPALWPLLPLAVGTIFLGLWKVVVSDASARGRNGDRALSAWWGLVALASADVALIPIFGLLGAGIASALGFVTAWLLAAGRWSAAGRGSVRDLLRVRRSDLTTVAELLRSLRSGRLGRSHGRA